MTIATSTLPTGPSDIDHYFNHPNRNADSYTVKHAPLTANVLLGLNGLTLMREAANHFLPAHHKGMARSLTGYAQLLGGISGMHHYATKFHEHPSVRSAVGFAAYAGFTVEGGARMFEAELAHPNVTAAAGAVTAATKAVNGGPLTTIPFILDAVCNVAEYAHGMAGPVGGLLGAMHTLTHQWRTQDLAGLQRNTGRVMIAIAVLKTLGLAAMPDAQELDAQAFQREVRDAYERIQGDAWALKFEQAQQESPAALEAWGAAFVEAMQHSGPAPEHQFAHLLAQAPGEVRSLIERHPREALDTATQLKLKDPQRWDELRQRYGADAFDAAA